jgi:hypothetical protein
VYLTAYRNAHFHSSQALLMLVSAAVLSALDSVERFGPTTDTHLAAFLAAAATKPTGCLLHRIRTAQDTDKNSV